MLSERFGESDLDREAQTVTLQFFFLSLILSLRQIYVRRPFLGLSLTFIKAKCKIISVDRRSRRRYPEEDLGKRLGLRIPDRCPTVVGSPSVSASR